MPATITSEELRRQIAERRDEVTAAELAVGAAELDGADVAAAQDRLAAARGEVQRTEAALAELERRSAASEQLAQQLAELRATVEVNRWAVEFLKAAARAHEAQAAADRALKRFADMTPPPVIVKPLRRFTQLSSPYVSDDVLGPLRRADQGGARKKEANSHPAILRPAIAQAEERAAEAEAELARLDGAAADPDPKEAA